MIESGLTAGLATSSMVLPELGIEQRVGNIAAADSSATTEEIQAAAKKTAAKMEKVGKDFEGVFLSLMLKEMRNTLEEGGFFGEESSDTYGGMFDMFIGQSMAETKPLGIANLLVENYARNQKAADVDVPVIPTQ